MYCACLICVSSLFYLFGMSIMCACYHVLPTSLSLSLYPLQMLPPHLQCNECYREEREYTQHILVQGDVADTLTNQMQTPLVYCLSRNTRMNERMSRSHNMTYIVNKHINSNTSSITPTPQNWIIPTLSHKPLQQLCILLFKPPDIINYYFLPFYYLTLTVCQ